MNKKTININGREIGEGQPPYVICELSANHNGSLNRQLELVDAAAKTGCDAIKIQTYTPDTMTLNVDRPEFRISGGLWDGRFLYELYQEAFTPYEWHEAIFKRARIHGVTIFSTPFDRTAVDLLQGLDTPAYKIASFELTDLILIENVARQGKPMIMSTGLATLAEIDDAVRTARTAGCEEIALLHCVSSYPAPDSDSNLRTIPSLHDAFGLPVGLSDHTIGNSAAIAAVALGASIIEKHFTLQRSDGGPDSAFSLEPDEFTSLCNDTHQAWDAMGSISYDLVGQEKSNVMFRRSIFAVKDIAEGTNFSEENIRIIRPGHGLPPKNYRQVIGRTAQRTILRGEPISWDLM